MKVLTDFNISGGESEPMGEQATNPFMPRPRGNNNNNKDNKKQ
jgi:HlyD family secretion protein